MREVKIGKTYRHFKYETLTQEEKNKKMYLYEVIGIANHSETKEKYVVYKKLYDDQSLWIRPYEMFLSKVDHEKYPNIKQEYRFEELND